MNTDHQLYHAQAAISFVHADFFDIGIGFTDGTGQQGDQAALVGQLDAQFDIELAADAFGPGQRD